MIKYKCLKCGEEFEPPEQHQVISHSKVFRVRDLRYHRIGTEYRDITKVCTGEVVPSEVAEFMPAI